MTTRLRKPIARVLLFAAVGFGATTANRTSLAETYQATGIKIGEVTDMSALVWTRLTAHSQRNIDGVPTKGKRANPALTKELLAEPARLEGACPGAAGRMRVRYATRKDLSDATATDWVDVSAKTDFSHQFALSELRSNTTYYLAVESTGPAGSPVHDAFGGKFRTAPAKHENAEVTFCVVTGQMYADLDHDDGFNIYPAMAKLAPRFVVFTGDNVYYDNEQPPARTQALARYHWERMYSLSRHVELLRNTASYWEKDDHDVLDNDCWPGRKFGQLTFAAGQAIFRQQTPQSEKSYRTFRWGKGLQVWLTEGRDFRSPNNMPDGPDKSIWGREQFAWLRSSLQASDARWKVIVSPTPIVGPDRGNKNDNHANRGFQHEGDAVRKWLAEDVGGNGFVVCGDRHWQYHSVDPATGVNELSAGPASDQHAGGSPGEDPEYHRFHRVKGGFLSATATAERITFRLHGVQGKVAYEWTPPSDK